MLAIACSRCSDLMTAAQIKSAADISKALKVIQDNLQDEILVEAAYWPEGQVKVQRPAFASIPADAPWPDYFEYYFSCTACGQLYRLAAETFHGIGGTWAPFERRS